MYDKKLTEIYTDEDQGFLSNIIIDKESFFIARYNQKFHKKSKILRSNEIKTTEVNVGLFEPWFSNLKEAFYGRMERGRMCHSVINISQNIEMVIQWDKNMVRDKNTGYFNTNEHFTLKIVCNVISQIFAQILLDINMKRVSQRSVNILKWFRDVTQETNIACIYEGVVNSLPNIFRAK